MRNIILFILLFINFSIFAQETKELTIVGKPKKLETGEMVARRDANCNYCAAIQVISNLDGFSYDSYDGMVGNIDDFPGKDIVYLTATERVLDVMKTGFKPLRIILNEYGISLKPREVWQIEINGENTADQLPVTILFTPADAKLMIDGKAVAASATQSLSVGQHTILISKDGYQNLEKTITVDEKSVYFNYKLEKQADAALQIETIPDKAEIYLDGVLLGESPIAAFYKPGNYPIKITKKGYLSIENEMLEVKIPQTIKSYTLEENVGYLTINTNPLASVYINNEKVTNFKDIKLAPQLVKIKVVMPKAETQEQQIVLKRNDKQVIDMYPDVQTGSLQIAVTPFDADVEVIGDAGERYTATGMKVFEDIPVGTYTLKVSATSYTSVNETALVNTGETTNKSIKLSKANVETESEQSQITDKVIKPNTETETERSQSTDGIEMVFVKGGTFTMGSPTNEAKRGIDETQHQVTLSDFQIGKYEVTQKQWTSIMGSNPSNFKGDNLPVEQVSWNDVQQFIQKLNQKTGKTYRLPTEAEWEYAAKGGSTAGGQIYSGGNNRDEVAWYSSNSGSKTHPVGQKMANALGIHDMSGNVWEWCSNWYGDYSSGSQSNPQGASSGAYRVFRGGSWYLVPRYCRVSFRFYGIPDFMRNDLGFRLVLAPQFK
jgi:formylglycine-generating enzyme required for sulfatase activity